LLAEALRDAMSVPRDVKIRKIETLFKSRLFEIGKLVVSHAQHDGKMRAGQERLIFDRGNAAAVLLPNVDAGYAVAVDQFRAETATPGGTRPTEAPGGVVDKSLPPASVAIRESLEETRYEVQKPKQGQVEQGGSPLIAQLDL
jgi:hypothetical protein